MSDINLEEIRRQDRTHVWHPMLQHRVLEKKDLLVVQESRGTEIVDVEGRRYLDAYAGIWNVNVGYGREEIVNAVNEQMKQLAFYPQTQVSLPAARLAAILSEILPRRSGSHLLLQQRVGGERDGDQGRETVRSPDVSGRKPVQDRRALPGLSRVHVWGHVGDGAGETQGKIRAAGSGVRPRRAAPARCGRPGGDREGDCA